MTEFSIINKYNRYQIFYGKQLLYTAIRQGFFNDTVIFYDIKNREFAVSKHKKYFILDFGHVVTFSDNKTVHKIKRKKLSTIFYFNNDCYEIKYGLLNRNPNLYFNGKICGNYELVYSSLGEFECKIICDGKDLCQTFSIFEIILDWFHVD